MSSRTTTVDFFPFESRGLAVDEVFSDDSTDQIRESPQERPAVGLEGVV